MTDIIFSKIKSSGGISYLLVYFAGDWNKPMLILNKADIIDLNNEWDKL